MTKFKQDLQDLKLIRIGFLKQVDYHKSVQESAGRLVLAILTDVENARKDVTEQLRVDEASVNGTSALIESVSQLLSAIENTVDLTTAPLTRVCSVASTELSARCQYELMMWVERQNVNGLQRVLQDILESTLLSFRESAALAEICQAKWNEKVEIEGQVVTECIQIFSTLLFPP